MNPDPWREDERLRARERLEVRMARRSGQKAAGRGQPQAGSNRRPSSRREGDGRGASAPDPRPAAFGIVSAIGQRAAETVSGLGRRGRTILVVAVTLLLLAILFLIPRACTGGESPEQSVPEDDAGWQEQAVDQDAPQQERLAEILGSDLAAELIAAAETSEDAAWIASHPDAFAVDGEAVQQKLLKLAAVEPEAMSFVRNFPDRYPSVESGSSDGVTQGEIPRLYQWDERWGYTVYSSTAFALTGCCPTSLAMVYQGLIGRNDLSPSDMGELAKDDGYMSVYDGTDASFLTAEAPNLGLSCETIPVDADSLTAALSDGAVVICNVGPGDFTDNGHFFVITGQSDDGRLVVNDPYSAERSNRTWDVETVIGQTRALYAYRVA